jgi:NitT/TauT family transport system substrate-binding protein
MDHLRVTATAKGLNYLPEYLADNAGLFAAHSLRVTAQAREPWNGVLDDLESGAADIALGGLWAPAMYAGIARDLVVVGQLNARFPMVVVTRERVEPFEWSWLSGRTVLVPGLGGTAPYEFTAGLIREAGRDPAATRFVRDLSNGMLNELFEGGLGDAFVTDLGTACSLQHRGVGIMSCQLAEVGGPMPNSVYYVRRDRLGVLQEVLVRFLSAIGDAMNQLASSEVHDLSDLLTKVWPHGDQAVLSRATQLLLGNGTWDGIRVDRAACNRWVAMLYQAGLLKAPVAFEDIVDTWAVDHAERAGERVSSAG